MIHFYVRDKMPTETLSIVDRVRRHLESEEPATPRVRVLDMAELSKGVVAVYLGVPGRRAWDVVLEPNKYRIKSWGGYFIEGTGLCSLSEIVRGTYIRSFQDALDFARKQLEPVTPEYDWYEGPILVD